MTLLRWRGERIEKIMLLPGDCPFHLIPERPEALLCALIAYHHGAKTHWTKATKAAIARHGPPQAMVYSFGKNEYGHPYRKNYRPTWDESATTTADARAAKRTSVDVTWEK